MYVIDRYLIREISKPLTAILSVLVVIFASYISTKYLTDAAKGLVAGDVVISLVLLKITIALEVLLPIALYLSIVLALGRLYSEYEIVALSATGVGTPRVLRAVFGLSLVLAVLVAGLSLYVRPWAYDKSYWLEEQAKADFDIGRFEAKRFYDLGENRVVIAEDVDQQKKRARRVFLQKEDDEKLSIAWANEAYQAVDEDTKEQMLVFVDGYAYALNRDGKKDRVVRFAEYRMPLRRRTITLEYKRKAAPTRHLARSNRRRDVAEFQWRVSTPLSTMLLALLALPLSRTAPRKGKYAKVFVAVVVFAIYYNVSIMAKNWVEQGTVGFLPGIWWVNVTLGVFVFALYSRLGLRFRWRSG